VRKGANEGREADERGEVMAMRTMGRTHEPASTTSEPSRADAAAGARPETWRCFVAVALASEQVRAGLRLAVDELREVAGRAGMRVSWTRPEGWHVTLEFLGEVATPALDDIGERLVQALAGYSSARVEVGGVCTLPPRRPPRVIAVTLEDAGMLGGLAQAAAAALEPCGFEVPPRPFVPHLTLGRVRRPGHWRPLARKVESMGERSFGSFVVERVGLYRSEPNRDGSRYTVIKDVELRAA
jgi:2'-5' RNA ligase